MNTETLVLFDIDGTLVLTLEAGIRSMNRAFARLHDRGDALHTVAVAGRPDLAIVTDAFRAIGVDASPACIEALRDAYFDELAAELARPAGPSFGVLPGVRALLDALEERPDVMVGLLTGNFEGGASIKLRYFDLWHRFRLGAFGDAHRDRRALVPVALARARELGAAVDPSRVVIIGDTPLDVDCAHAHGAVAVAVATGNYTAEALTKTGANLVVGTLAECDAACGWLDALVARNGQRSAAGGHS